MGIYVDVDLEEFREEDIVEYLQGLGYSVNDNGNDIEDEDECGHREVLMELYRQYRTKDARLLDTLREYLSETLGKVM